MKIRFVPQRHSTDCGVACVAMIAGVSYQEAFDAFRFSPDQRQFYTTHTCLTKALGRLGISVLRKKFRSWQAIPGLAIVAVNHRCNRQLFHWVMFDGRQILDPMQNKYRQHRASGFYLLLSDET